MRLLLDKNFIFSNSLIEMLPKMPTNRLVLQQYSVDFSSLSKF